MSDAIDVVIVGGGQAGLAVSRELTRAGVAHLVLERGRVGEAWRGRWDSFCLVTPNWSVQLPDRPYDGPEPDGFMPREEIVAYLVGYAEGCQAPVHEGIAVSSLTASAEGGFVLETSAGSLAARSVVVCTGAYQRPHRPAAAAALPTRLLQIDADQYRNPGELPAGAVLVVGSGQSGCQIAEELCEAGRDVFLACGRAGWAPRRIGEHDLVWWLLNTGDLDDPLSSLPSPAARLGANLQASGRDGGHDLHYRTLQRLGVTLLGHLRGSDGRRARFAPDFADSVAWGDERNAKFMERIEMVAGRLGIDLPDVAAPERLNLNAPETVDLSRFGAVVFAAGYRPHYESWIHCPAAFDELGFPIHEDGASTRIPGLYFVGVHFLRKRKSSLLIGVGEDAALVAGKIAQRAEMPLTASTK